jgi:hypothetical protein
MKLSNSWTQSSIDFEPADLSASSVELLDNLRLSDSVSVGTEDGLWQFILKRGPSSRGLVRHIQIEFLSEGGLSLLNEHFDIPPPSI